MPEHGTVRSVLVLGAGPQACRALTELGLRVVLVDPDPGTVTTDPEFADATYVEPLTPESVENVIARERPDALLPALHGRAALDTAVALHEAGTLDRYGVRLLGADAGALHRAAEAVGAGVDRARAVPEGRRYGLQLLRDRNGATEVVCTFETFDLPGGGTITVAPARTPTTRVYDMLRDVGRSVVREIGAGAGGCTLWCAVRPESRGVTVLDVDPRGAREAALVACATGLPMAGICAELAVGRTLDETSVRSRPAPGHVAVRAVAPSGAEALAVGHTFTGALHEALARIASDVIDGGRIGTDPWLAEQLAVIRKVADEVACAPELTGELMDEAKRHGFRDHRIGELRGLREDVVREIRYALGVRSVPPVLGPGRCRDGQGPTAGRTKPVVIVLGRNDGASAALRAARHETVVVGRAPMPPSADWDERAADRFYCAPLTTEAVLEVVHAERRGGPVAGVCVQFGGADATRLARDLADQGVRVLGAPPSAVLATEGHDTFQDLVRSAGLTAVRYATASSPAEARAAAEAVEYPVTVRWAGGDGRQELVPDAEALASLLGGPGSVGGAWPVVIGQVVRDAVEVVVDALFDGEEVYLGGVLERLGWVDVSDAGAVHVLPAVTLGGHDIERVRAATRVLAGALGVRGALTVRCALAGGVLHVRGAEPRVSGTVPFTTQATGVPLARAAARIALGASVAELRAEGLLPTTGDGTTLPPGAPVAVAQTLPGTGVTTGSGTEADSGEAAGGGTEAGRGEAAGGGDTRGDGDAADIRDAGRGKDAAGIRGVRRGRGVVGIGEARGDGDAAGIRDASRSKDTASIREARGDEDAADIQDASRARGAVRIEEARGEGEAADIRDAGRGKDTAGTRKARGDGHAAGIQDASRARGAVRIEEARGEGEAASIQDTRRSKDTADTRKAKGDEDAADIQDASRARAVVGIGDARGEGEAAGIRDAGRGKDTAGIGDVMRGAEAMGVGESFGVGYAKSRAAVGGPLPTKGRVLLAIADRDRRSVVFPARELAVLGFELLATGGLVSLLRRNGVKAGALHTIDRTLAARLVRDEQIDLVVVTHHRGDDPAEGQGVLAAAFAQGVPCLTTVRDLAAAVQGIDALRRPRERTRLRPLQHWQSRQSRTTH